MLDKKKKIDNDESVAEFEKLSAERKYLTSIGEVPEFYITQGLRMFQEKYAYNGESVRGAFERMASHFAKYVPHLPEAKDKFFRMLWKGNLAAATPVYNGGTNRGHCVSCSGSYVHDSIRGFYKTNLEIAMLSKNGYGTSAYLDDIRPRGSSISSGGRADGVVPVLDTLIDTTSKVNQGNNRRGQVASYVSVDHDDFWEIAGYLQKNHAKTNIGWIYRDTAINNLRLKDKESIRRWNRISYLRARTGKGYIWKQDVANRLAPAPIRNCGIPILASNLCVAPETLVLTDAGYKEIQTLKDQKVNVWNGEEWSEVEVKQTGTNQELVKVITDCGIELECTPYHKFYVVTDYKNRIVEKRAIDLLPDDKLIKFDLPIIEGSKELHLPYLNGFFTGDGCRFKNKSIVYLYGEKRSLSEYIKQYSSYHSTQEDQDRETFYVDGLKYKFFVPDSTYTIDSRIEWFAGLLDSDGTLAKNGDSQSLQIGSVHKEFLKEVQLMLQTLGVHSKVKKSRDACLNLMPMNNGTGDKKEYECKSLYRLLISGNGINVLLSNGLKTKRLNIKERVPNRNAERFFKVVSLENNGRYDDTYCFSEQKRHMGMFNGILTGQCSEISLPQNSEYTFSCVLSSLNLFNWDTFDPDTIYWATIFLDCVVEDTIEKTADDPEFERIHRFTRDFRAIGLGALGFHSYLQKKGIPFESLEAKFINTEIFRKIDEESMRASKDLARDLGEPKFCKGYGVRNATRIAVAPNTSSALLCGGMSQGIEPIVANTYVQNLSCGEVTRMNPLLVELLKQKGIYSIELMRDININHYGSIQHLKELSEHEKLMYRTAFEMDQHALVRMAADRQTYIDQAQSLNLFHGTDERYISRVAKWALLNDKIKSLYYLRSMRGIRASKGTESECIACEG